LRDVAAGGSESAQSIGAIVFSSAEHHLPKLLSLNNYHYRRGGSDVMFMAHDALFQSIGWETAMMAMQHPRNTPSPWQKYFVDELEFGYDYSPLQKIGMVGKVVYSLEARQKLGRMLESFRPDVAHSHCIYHHLSPSVLGLLKARGVPTVMTAHDLKLACPAYKMFNRTGVCERCRGGNLLHVVANRCVRESLGASVLVAVESAVHKSLGLYKRNLDRVVVPSRFYQQKLQEWGWDEAQLRYIPYYIDADAFEPRYEGGDYFIYFGRLAPEKGLPTLIAAAVAANVKLRLVGTGPMDAELRAKTPPNVEYLGFQTGDDLWRQVRGARAAVVPSEWYENAPVSIMESYACGKPVIGARIGGISEMIAEGETGFLFDSGSVDQLAAALGKVAGMAAPAVAALGRAARRRVVEQFNRDLYLEAMLGLYRELGVAVDAGRAVDHA
jgi:glycosyltransferase involved in cell wall biosynthesis